MCCRRTWAGALSEEIPVKKERSAACRRQRTFFVSKIFLLEGMMWHYLQNQLFGSVELRKMSSLAVDWGRQKEC